MRNPFGNTETSSCRCEPCPVRPARRTGSDNLATGRMEAGWKEGTATGLAMRRCASEWAVRSKPRKCVVLGADSFDAAGGHGVVHHSMAQDGGAPGGVKVDGNLEGDDPGTWETHALGGEPEAEGKGDRSPRPNARWESEGPIRARTRGNE
jgi:hypothetical protein